MSSSNPPTTTTATLLVEATDAAPTPAQPEHYEVWDEQTIESRQNQLAKISAGVWKVDFQ